MSSMLSLPQNVFKAAKQLAFDAIGNSLTPRQIGRSNRGPTAFSFGDPEPVLGGNITNYLGVFAVSGNDYFDPPVSMQGLANIKTANAHHETALHFKRNMILKWYEDNDVLPLKEFAPAVFDRFVFGNCYFLKIYNVFDQVIGLKHLPAMYMRKMKKGNRYCQLQSNGVDKIEYKLNEVIHLKDYDIKQKMYGVPEYLGGIQSILLNESATLFRRKYYENGAHMGFVFYTADADFEEADEEALKQEIKASKGAGNFRSMFLNVPGGKPDSVKIIPVGDIATKDEFERIKNATQADIISIHRIQPALAGVISEANGGHGDIEKISKVQYENETVPSQLLFLEINEFLEKERHISFTEQVFAD